MQIAGMEIVAIDQLDPAVLFSLILVYNFILGYCGKFQEYPGTFIYFSNASSEDKAEI